MFYKTYILDDETLVITIPRNKNITRVLVQHPGTQVGELYYPDEPVEYNIDDQSATAQCPSCGYDYYKGYRPWKQPYCPHCGKRLNWSD